MIEVKPRSIWRRDVAAWCCYDWANSGYTTLMITVFVVYIQRVVFNADEDGSTGAVVWAWSVSLSMLVGAILSPIVGAMADANGRKRFGLGLTAMGGGLACVAMAAIPTHWPWAIVGCFVVANLCLEVSLTFYNGFLPEIAEEAELNRVSAAGMGWGYFGGGLALLAAMLVLAGGGSGELTSGANLLRGCIAATGVWWIVFTIPVVAVLRDRPRKQEKSTLRQATRSAVNEVVDTIKQFRTERTILLFLIAFLIYNDGLQTVISQASTFALDELQFKDSGLIAVVLMIQFVAAPGAILIGWLSDRFGRKRALIICLSIWIALLTSAWFVQTQVQYWFLAFGVAMVLGGTQAVSRAIMGGLTPIGQEARYFGFFNFSGKATSFLGTFFFGLIVIVTGSSRLAIVNLVLFFAIGLLIICRLDLTKVESQPIHKQTDQE